ncbi:ATP-binding cassette domain-containing protein [Actinocrinis sp.]|uniref:ATP-binding cassette domain-containing protein n=1 Tax=Actinocrinis sp. TaxID=1920516 RepID=UPI002B9E1142|nr:ATP-binding cassette domain-containing protein [Actinocrinis sp.]HXR69644.1 ATP-binding cassette domain-containing protein [Actinocrinis sp.]
MIEAIDLTVRRRGRTVLDAVSFDVRPGQVTGVLGGTGAGKTVLLRRMVELERGRGETLFDGRPYRALHRPMREVGLLLGPAVGDPDRTVRGYLRLALATDRGAAREGILAGARRSSDAGTANRHERGGAFGNVDNWHTVGERGAGGQESADARMRSGAGHHFGVGTGTRVDGGRDNADAWERAAERGREAADVHGATRGAAGRPDGTRASARNASGLPATVNSLGLDAEEEAEFADVLAACGEYPESLAECDGAGVAQTGARRRGRSHDNIEGDDLAGRGWRFGFGRRSRRDETDLADRIEATRRGRPADRIEAVLDIVGLTEQSRTRLSDLTEGMATRLGIAVALLGDPKTLLLDCPDRALEPEGVAWLGALLRAFTAQGRAALVTGSDTETLIGMVDRVLLLDSGYLVGTRTAEEVLRAPTGASVVVRSPQIVRFAAILGEAGARSTQGEGACLEVRGLDRARVGDLAYRHNIPVHELSDRFTGSDPGDLVLAACTGRRVRPVVPIQVFPDGKRVVGVPTPVSVGTSAPLSGMRSWGAKALRPARVDGARAAGEPVSNVRVVNSDADSEPSVRLITVLPDPAAQAQTQTDAQAERAADSASELAGRAVPVTDPGDRAGTSESAGVAGGASSGGAASGEAGGVRPVGVASAVTGGVQLEGAPSDLASDVESADDLSADGPAAHESPAGELSASESDSHATAADIEETHR